MGALGASGPRKNARHHERASLFPYLTTADEEPPIFSIRRLRRYLFRKPCVSNDHGAAEKQSIDDPRNHIGVSLLTWLNGRRKMSKNGAYNQIAAG